MNPNICLIPKLFQNPDSAPGTDYHRQNQKQKQQLLLSTPPVDMPPEKLKEVIGLKGADLDANAILAGCVYVDSVIDKNIYAYGYALNLLNGVLYFINNIRINLADLLIIYLEKTFHLSNGLKAWQEDRNLSVKRAIEFFARVDIQDDLKLAIYTIILRHKANKRTKDSIAQSTEKESMSLLISKVAYAFSSKILTEADIKFWVQFPDGYSNWSKAWEQATIAEKLLSTKNLGYKPWLVIIRKKLLSVSISHQQLLSQPHIPKLIECVVNWLNKLTHRNLVFWLLTFLFHEDCKQTKRPFLYLHGAPSSGKTFFLSILTPNTDDGFVVKNCTFAHFGSEKPVEYDLHLLLFDDPGEAKGKGNFITNLAFMKGQVAIISNRNSEEVFISRYVEAMQTRLMKVEIELNDPFPLRGKSLIPNQFIFNDEVSEADAPVFDFMPEEIFPRFKPPAGEEEEKKINEDEDRERFLRDLEEETQPQDDLLEEDVMFYILWCGLFKVMQNAIIAQTPSIFQAMVPNAKLRSMMKDCNELLINLICKTLSEAELLELMK